MKAAKKQDAAVTRRTGLDQGENIEMADQPPPTPPFNRRGGRGLPPLRRREEARGGAFIIHPPPSLGAGSSSFPGGVWSWILDNVKTLDATGGVKPFPDYAFARRLVESLGANRFSIVAKSRQMMATWSAAAFFLHRALHDTPGIYLLLSKGARDSGELVKRLKVMISNLPDEIGEGIKIKAGEASFLNGSRIIALPATEFAPRMHSPAGVFWDEMAFTPNSEEIWASVKPAVDSGGTFVGVSTPNGTDNVFHALYSDPSNGFAKLRLHWSEHPQRDDIWRQAAARGLSEARWRQEYEVDFNVLADRVFDEFDAQLHVLPEPFEPRGCEGRIYRGIDFGYHHPYVVWVHQAASGELTLFDEWEGENATLDEVAAAIRRVDARNGLSEEGVTFSGCDPAGAAVDDEGVSAVERLGKVGFKLVWRTSRIASGVDLVKSLLKDATGKVRLRFSPRASRTIHHLLHYRWEPCSDRPSKDDGHDHAADALRYLIVNIWGRKPVAWSGAKVLGVRG